MSIIYRKAVPEDAATCVNVRGRTRENAFSVAQLKTIGVTVESWRQGIADDTMPGYVCLHLGDIVGYCFGNSESGEIVVLALLPDYENRGIGKALLEMMIEEFRSLGFKRLYLGCSTNSSVRSHGFYRHLGWQPTGTIDAHNDEVLELFLV